MNLFQAGAEFEQSGQDGLGAAQQRWPWRWGIPKQEVESNARTLVVGAMDQGQSASNSCRYPSVRILANGNVGEEEGTSSATPRVGAMLQQTGPQAQRGVAPRQGSMARQPGKLISGEWGGIPDSRRNSRPSASAGTRHWSRRPEWPAEST